MSQKKANGDFRSPFDFKKTGSVTIVFRLVRAFHGHAEVIRLFLGELGELHANFFKVQAGDFFVEFLGETIDADFRGVFVLPEVQLREDLIGETVAHHETRVAGGAAEVHEAAFRQHVNAVAAGESIFVHLRFDGQLLHAFRGVQTVNLDLVVEVADVADDGLVFHLRHVFEGDDVAIAGGGDVEIGGAEGVFDGCDFKAFHRGLQGVNGVNLGDDDARAEAAERMRGAFADIAVTTDDRDFAGDHDVGRALDAVGEGFAAAVEVVEFGFGDGVVDVDGGNQKFPLFEHLIQAMNAGGGFLGNAFPIFHDFMPETGAFLGDAFQQVFDDGNFVAVAGGVDPVAAVFEFVTFVDEQRGVAAIVHDKLRAFVAGMRERGEGEVPVFFEGFALEREDRDARLGNRGSGVVLGREDIATGPAHGRAEFHEGLDQDRGLNGHVQRTGDAHALERFEFAVLGADGHQAGHFVLGNLDSFTTPLGQRDVSDEIIVFGRPLPFLAVVLANLAREGESLMDAIIFLELRINSISTHVSVPGAWSVFPR